MKSRVSIIICTMLLFLSCVSFAEEDEWFPECGLQPYSMEEQELSLQEQFPPLIVKFPNGLIVDWNKGLIVVRGQEFITGKPTPENKKLIEQGAIYNAKMKMVKLIDELRIDNSKRMADLLENSPKLSKKVKDLIMNRSKVIHERYRKDQKVLEVTLSLDIYGKNSIAEALYWDLFYWENAWDKYYPTYKPLSTEAYTGLIIDARGLNLEPAFLPRVVNENEENLYRDKYVQYDILISQGLVQYCDNIDEAMADLNRIGTNPLMVKAVTTVKSTYNTDVILSGNDEKRIKAADKKGGFLKYLRVIIVL